jgi:hypothetical protein
VKVSDLIRSIKGPEARANHNLSLYRKAFCDFSAEGESVVATGSDSVVLKLQDGNILKISSHTITRELEPFDLPMLTSGTMQAEGRTIYYVIQPEAEPAALSDFAMFLRILTDHGFRMTDPGISQIGIYQGQVKLLDSFAVTKD